MTIVLLRPCYVVQVVRNKGFAEDCEIEAARGDFEHGMTESPLSKLCNLGGKVKPRSAERCDNARAREHKNR